jgi:hypothetical protein
MKESLENNEQCLTASAKSKDEILVDALRKRNVFNWT